MRILESKVAQYIKQSIETEFGSIYFFNITAVVEFNEGIHVDGHVLNEIAKDLNQYFGDISTFGLVANRVNSYSISLADVEAFKDTLENLTAYAVVGYNNASIMNAEFENSFSQTHDISFDNLYEALDTVYARVKHNTLSTLD